MKWILLVAVLLSGCAGVEMTEYPAHEAPETDADSGHYDVTSVSNRENTFVYTTSAHGKEEAESYTWDTTRLRARISVSGVAYEGEASIKITDTLGLTVYEGDIQNISSTQIHSQRGVPGPWTIQMTFDDFSGVFSLSMQSTNSAA